MQKGNLPSFLQTSMVVLALGQWDFLIVAMLSISYGWFWTSSYNWSGICQYFYFNGTGSVTLIWFWILESFLRSKSFSENKWSYYSKRSLALLCSSYVQECILERSKASKIHHLGFWEISSHVRFFPGMTSQGISFVVVTHPTTTPLGITTVFPLEFHAQMATLDDTGQLIHGHWHHQYQ